MAREARRERAPHVDTGRRHVVRLEGVVYAPRIPRAWLVVRMITGVVPWLQNDPVAVVLLGRLSDAGEDSRRAEGCQW